MNLTDTHSHLYEPEFDADREEALARAAEAGVERRPSTPAATNGCSGCAAAIPGGAFR